MPKRAPRNAPAAAFFLAGMAVREANMDRLVVTVEEAGRLLCLSRASAYAACASGQIPVIRIGRRLLVPKARLEAMLKGEPEPAAVEA